MHLKKTLLALAFFPAWAGAAVVDSAANGFTVKVTLAIQAAPDQVYRNIVHKIGDWWDPSHTYSRDSHNLSIEEKPMGCFCEKLPSGGVRHMEIVNYAPGRMLVMVGGLGPLQATATAATMRIVLAPDEKATKLEVTYAVGGYMAGGLNPLAGIVDGVLTQQFSRLKTYTERGDQAAK